MKAIMPTQIDPNCFCSQEITTTEGTKVNMVKFPVINPYTGDIVTKVMNVTHINSLHLNNCYPALAQSSECKIGDNFLKGAVGLVDLSLEGLGWWSDEKLNKSGTPTEIGLHREGIRSIGNSFLEGCINLKSVDMWNMPRLESIGDNFLKGCNFDWVDLPEYIDVTGATSTYNVPTITTTQTAVESKIWYGYNCTTAYNTATQSTGGWQTIIGQSTTVQNGANSAFYYDEDEGKAKNVELGTVSLSNLCTTNEGKITLDIKGGTTKTIKAENLISIAVGNTTDITVGANFLKGCTNLVYVELDGLTNVTSIGDDFMSGCTSLLFFEFISTAALNNVATIGKNFMQGCTSLRSVSLFRLKKLTTAGDNFLAGCTKLKGVILPFVFGDAITPFTLGSNPFDGSLVRRGSTIWAFGKGEAEAYQNATTWANVKDIIKSPLDWDNVEETLQ